MFMGQPLKMESGDADKALAAAPYKVDADYTHARATTTTRSSCTPARSRGTGTRCASTTPRSSSRTPPGPSPQVFGIEEEQVRVTSPFVGGGFGGKCLWWHQMLAAAAAKLAGGRCA